MNWKLELLTIDKRMSNDVVEYIETLKSGECISERGIRHLCAAVIELQVEESNVQPVLSPVTVCVFSLF
jgi:hypothetical protein